MKHRRIGGMSGQESKTSDGGITDAAKAVAISIATKYARRWIMDMGNKPATQSNTVRGLIIALVSFAGSLALNHFASRLSTMDALTLDSFRDLLKLGMASGAALAASGFRKVLGDLHAAQTTPPESK